jgi:hypothetical protein
LDGGQEQCGEQSDDGNDDHQFDEGHGIAIWEGFGSGHWFLDGRRMDRPDDIKMGEKCKKKPGSVLLPSRASILKSGVQG